MYLNSLPLCKAYKIISTNERGVSDIFVCYHGLFLTIEIKVPGEDATPIQNAQIEIIRRAGGYGCVSHSVEETKTFIDEIGKKNPKIKSAVEAAYQLGLMDGQQNKVKN